MCQGGYWVTFGGSWWPAAAGAGAFQPGINTGRWIFMFSFFGIPLNTFHVFFSEWLSPTQHWVAFQAWIKKDKELESTLLATQKYTWFANVASSLGRTIWGKEGTTFFDWKEQYDQRCRVVDLYNRFSSPQSQPQKMYGYNINLSHQQITSTVTLPCVSEPSMFGLVASYGAHDAKKGGSRISDSKE